MYYKISSESFKTSLLHIFRDNHIYIPSKIEIDAWNKLFFSNKVMEQSIFTLLHLDTFAGVEHNPSQELLDYLLNTYSQDIEKCILLTKAINPSNFVNLFKIFTSYDTLEILYNENSQSFELNNPDSFVNFYLNYDDDTVDILSNNITINQLNLSANQLNNSIEPQFLDNITNNYVYNQGYQIFPQEMSDFLKNPENYSLFVIFFDFVSNKFYSNKMSSKYEYVNSFLTQQVSNLKKHLNEYFSTENNIVISELQLKYLTDNFPIECFDDLKLENFCKKNHYLKIFQNITFKQNLFLDIALTDSVLNSKLSDNTLSIDTSHFNNNIQKEKRSSLQYISYIVEKTINNEDFILSFNLCSDKNLKSIYPFLPLQIRENNFNLSLAFSQQMSEYYVSSMHPEYLQLFNFIPKEHLKRNEMLSSFTNSVHYFHSSKIVEHCLSYYIDSLLESPLHKITNLILLYNSNKFIINFEKVNYMNSFFLTEHTKDDYIDEQSQHLSSKKIKQTIVRLYKRHIELQENNDSLSQDYLILVNKFSLLLSQNHIGKKLTIEPSIAKDDFLYIFNKLNQSSINYQIFKDVFLKDILNATWNSNNKDIISCQKFLHDNIISLHDILNNVSFHQIKMSTQFWENLGLPYIKKTSTGISELEFKQLLDNNVNTISLLKYTTFCQQFNNLSINSLDFWKTTIDSLETPRNKYFAKDMTLYSPISSYSEIIELIPKKMFNNVDFCLYIAGNKKINITQFKFPNHILNNTLFITKILDNNSEELVRVISTLYDNNSVQTLFNNAYEEFSILLNKEIMDNLITYNEKTSPKIKKF